MVHLWEIFKITVFFSPTLKIPDLVVYSVFPCSVKGTPVRCRIPQSPFASVWKMVTKTWSVQSNPGFLCFCLTSLCGWSRKLATTSWPMRCKTNFNRDLITHVFARFWWFAFLWHEFSLADDFFPLSWFAVVILSGFSFLTVYWKLL